MNILVEIVGLAGFAANVWANLLIARKSETGWWVRLVANVLWLLFSIGAISIANFVSSIVFMGINIYGLVRWRKERLMPKKCGDHYLIRCFFCSEIVRQCPCPPGTSKAVSRDGICGVCRPQTIQVRAVK